MTAEQIAKKYVHGMHDALTDRQEIKDMITDIETYAEEHHQSKLKLFDIPMVSQCYIISELDKHSYNLYYPKKVMFSKEAAEEEVKKLNEGKIDICNIY